jgi:hypothetical protein
MEMGIKFIKTHYLNYKYLHVDIGKKNLNILKQPSQP